MIEAFFSGFVQVFTPATFSLLLLGILIGFAVGILPGIGGLVTLALMLPFIFDMKPLDAFAFLLGMLSVTSTTGDITSILFGVPGESISAALILDGHQMAKHGEAGRALGAALMSSLVGAIIGAFVLAASIPVVAPLVLTFKSPEFFALALLGITFVASLSGESKLKGMIAAGAGLVLSMVGLDPQSGMPRYTLGMAKLWDGVGLVAVTVGLFAIPEIVDLWVRGTSIAEKRIGKLGGVGQGIRDAFTHWGITVRCSLIGTFIGIIPGLGAGVSQWLAYAHAVQSSSDKNRFGAGDVRGVLGPGAANNSGLGGSLVPTIAFGVPGSVVMALLLGAFLIKGLVPGPSMLTKHLDLTFAFVWFIVISNIITVMLSLVFLEQLAKITYVRGALLVPGILLLVYLGAYVETKSIFDMGVALVFGLIGLIMVHIDWPRPPLILGLVLGSLIERNFFISYEIHALGFFFKPSVLIILAAGLGALFYCRVKTSLAGD
ncbi:MAG TPA: tripartite tricarboxylate transporter permease [Candidatus Udaeobacter sp.]|nr:tripartite tricarboxylate transporter permease [Candidatus Udaeobacter sp.]